MVKGTLDGNLNFLGFKGMGIISARMVTVFVESVLASFIKLMSILLFVRFFLLLLY